MQRLRHFDKLSASFGTSINSVTFIWAYVELKPPLSASMMLLVVSLSNSGDLIKSVFNKCCFGAFYVKFWAISSLCGLLNLLFSCKRIGFSCNLQGLDIPIAAPFWSVFFELSFLLFTISLSLILCVLTALFLGPRSWLFSMYYFYNEGIGWAWCLAFLLLFLANCNASFPIVFA